jgi:hypothetical protein
VRLPKSLQEWAAVAGIIGVGLALIGILSGAVGKIGDTLSGEPSAEDFIAEVDGVCREFAERTGGGRLRRLSPSSNGSRHQKSSR